MGRPIRRHRRKRNSKRVITVVIFLIIFIAIGVLAAILLKFDFTGLRNRFGSIFPNSEPSQVSVTPEPTPTPEPIYFPSEGLETPRLEPLAVESDNSFLVEGNSYPYSTYLLFGNEKYVCVKLSELANFLDAESTIDAKLGVYTLTYRGMDATFFSDTSA